MEEVRKQLESQHKLQSSFSNLREENSRLASKLDIWSLASNWLCQEKEASRNRIGCITVSQLETEMRRHESEKKFLIGKWNKSKRSGFCKQELAETRSRQCELINENTSLRQGLAEAIKKAELYRNQNVELAKTSDSLRADLEPTSTNWSVGQPTWLYKPKDFIEFFFRISSRKIAELKSELAQKEKLASYLQSVVQPKQMQKLSRKTSSHTLISTGDEAISNIEIESKQCEELEQRRDDMLNNLEHQRRGKSSDFFLFAMTRGNVPSPRNSSTSCRMSHEIPHRWKKQFISLNATNCVVCYEGLPHFGHVFKCRECSLMVHSHCKPNIVNTCGLPTECANFYLGPYSTSGNTMTGWVKLWRSDDTSGNKWRNAWAVIDDHRLSFFDTDNLALNDGAPFSSIDWTMNAGKYSTKWEACPDGVTGENMSMIIEIKLPNFTLFMLAPVQASNDGSDGDSCGTRHEMLLAICGSARLLVVLHLQQVRRALKSDQPSVQYTPISNIDNCTYIYLATADAIHILQFVQKLGVFSPVKQIKTDEPCRHVHLQHFYRLHVWADHFHIARFEEFTPPC
uniref:Phorbol-ester/DAG-type domain-containing protein n=1 Tax=Ditylenchus dipsaci TaxID=166011 RepID=A0A915DEA6_9BILA